MNTSLNLHLHPWFRLTYIWKYVGQEVKRSPSSRIIRAVCCKLFCVFCLFQQEGLAPRIWVSSVSFCSLHLPLWLSSSAVWHVVILLQLPRSDPPVLWRCVFQPLLLSALVHYQLLLWHVVLGWALSVEGCVPCCVEDVERLRKEEAQLLKI